MNGLENRVKKLEKRADIGKGHLPAIVYFYDDVDSEEVAATAKADAVTAWEAENGQLGNRKPLFIGVRFVSPPALEPPDVV